MGNHAAKPQAGQTAPCPRCGHQNESGRRFCTQCGTGLTETCPACGQSCELAQRFCGHCGENVQALVEAQQRKLEQAWAAAETLETAGEYAEAMARLRAVTTSAQRHPRLQSWRGRIAARIEQVAARVKQCEQQAQAALAAAQEHVARHDYAAAIAALKQVTPSRQDEPVRQLLADCQSKRQSLQTLRREVQAAVRAGQTRGLLSKVQQLLDLNPRDSQVEQLAGKLSRLHQKTAHKRLAEHRYAAAQELLAQIPPRFRTPEADRLAEQAAELNCLMNDLRSAPYIDQTLLAVSDRLGKMDPGNAAARRLREKLKVRANGHVAAAKWPAAVWCPAPSSPLLGVPVDWLPPATSLADEAGGAAALYWRQADRFAVACGLALQGLGDVPISTNLMPKENEGLRDRWKNLIRKRDPLRCAWGVDVGSVAIKAVRLVRDDEVAPARIAACELVELDEDEMAASQPPRREQLVQAALEGLATRHPGLMSEGVVAGLPGAAVLGRYLAFPPVEGKKLDAMLQYEVKQQIPFPESELVWDHHVFASPDIEVAGPDQGDSSANQQRRVLLLAVKQWHAERLLALFQHANVKVTVLQSSCVALHNLAVHQKLSTGEAVAIIDVGHRSTDLVVSSPDAMWLRRFEVSGNDITDALVRQWKLTRKAATKLKQNPHTAQRFHQYVDGAQPVFADVAKEIRLSLAFFGQTYPRQTVTRLYGIGGGFRTHGLLRYLRSGS